MKNLIGWLVLLLALNLLLPLITVDIGASLAAWITVVIVAIIGIMLVTKKK